MAKRVDECKIIELIDAGKSMSEIMAILKISDQTVKTYAKKNHRFDLIKVTTVKKPTLDIEKVERIKAQIAAGQYVIDVEAIADKFCYALKSLIR